MEEGSVAQMIFNKLNLTQPLTREYAATTHKSVPLSSSGVKRIFRQMYLETFLWQSGWKIETVRLRGWGGFLINLLPIATDSYFLLVKKTDVVLLLTGPAAQNLIQYHPIPNNTNSFAQWCP